MKMENCYVKGSFITHEGKICILDSIVGDTAEIIFIAVSEAGDDVYVFKKKTTLGEISPIDESFVSSNGYLAYVRSLIVSGEDIMFFAA